MLHCDRCHWKYPAHILKPLNSSQGTINECCGICALEVSNEIHKNVAPRLCFNGPIAEEMRLRAIDWRTKNPECAPEEPIKC